MKRRVYEILCREDRNDRAGLIMQSFILVLIALSIASIVAESFQSISNRFGGILDGLEMFTIIVFTIEYLMRLYTADLLYPEEKHPYLKFLLSPIGIIDLLAILPFYLPFLPLDLRFLRMGRLLWPFHLFLFFKLGRYFESLTTIFQVIRESAPHLITSTILCLFVMVFASIIMYTFENPAQPEQFPNIIASLWWAVSAITTIGYGDVYPITPVGKFFASIIALVGVGVIALPTGIIAAGFNATMNQRLYDIDATKIKEAGLSKKERELIAAYRMANRTAREIAFETLENHPAKTKTSPPSDPEVPAATPGVENSRADSPQITD